MENYDYDYLMHYGVKGMKWGVRRYQNADGSLNAKGIKKYARAGYAQDSYNSNKSKLGKAYDKVTGAHKFGGDMMYNMSSQKANKARAEKYVADKQAKKEAKSGAKAARADVKEHVRKAKETGKAKTKTLIEKNKKKKYSAILTANEVLSGTKAVESILKGDIASAYYHGSHYNALKTNRKFWTDYMN